MNRTPEDRAVQYAYELWYPSREAFESKPWEYDNLPLDHPPYRRSVRDFLAGYRVAEAAYKEDAERWRRLRKIKSINTDRLRPRDWDAMADELK